MNKTLAWMSVAWALCACNGGPMQFCQPGFVRTCQCGSQSGTQQCFNTGESFTTCSCDTSADAGNDTGTDSYVPPDTGSFDAGDPCAANTTCGTCTAGSNCGFCRTTGRCSTGTASGPSSGTCSNWAWYQSDCTAADSGVPPDTGSGGSLCTGGLVPCGASNTCTNLNSDTENCGSCGSCCDPSGGYRCISGVCTGGFEGGAIDCAGGYTYCCGSCRDLQNDAMHCGSCRHQCPHGVACIGGCCGGNCSPHCGDGVCNGSETRASCPTDCATCGASAPTIACSNGDTCPIHSSCDLSSGSTYCNCNPGYTAVDCSGIECTSSHPCAGGNWSCQLLGCGTSNFASLCADGHTTCPVGSTCNAAGTGCVCGTGLSAVSCSGTPCSGSCAYPNWWCQ